MGFVVYYAGSAVQPSSDASWTGRFYCLVTFFGKDPLMAVTRVPLSKAEERHRERQEKLEMSTAEIGLSVRTTNCLEEKGIFTVQDLLKTTPSDLLGISNFGEKTLEEVYKALDVIGFSRTQKPK